MSGLLQGLAAEAYDRSYSDGALLARVGALLARERAVMLGAVGVMVASTLLGLLVPYTISRLIGAIDRTSVPLVLLLVAGVALAGGLAWLLQYWQNVWTRRAIANVVLHIQQQTFDAALRQSPAFFARSTGGQVVARITGDTQAFSSLVTLSLSFCSQLLLVVGVLIMLWWTNAALAAVVTALIPAIFLVALAFRAWARQSTRQAQRALANVNAAIGEAIGGLSVAKSFGQEALLLDDFRAVNETAFRVQVRQGMVFSALYPVLGVVTGLSVALVASLGGRAVLAGTLSTGEWYLFVQALNYFVFPLTALAAFWSQFQQGLAAVERIFSLLDHEDAPVARTDVASGHGRIELRNVSFRYGDTTVLDNVSGVIEPGQTVTLIGPTGAGKTTLAKLLSCRQWPDEGEVLIDGVATTRLEPAHVGRLVGYVAQEPFLFADSVLENIRMGRLDATDEEVRETAEALLPGWTRQLPQGLDTRVGERGGGISLGQRQLVVLARIALQNPPILVLDEATANVDPWTELQFLKALEHVQRGRTCLLIAHRPDTIARAERVLELSGGRLVERSSEALGQERVVLRGAATGRP